MAGLTALLAVAALVWTTAEAKKGVAKNTKVEELGKLRSMSWESKDGVIRMDKASDLTPLLEGLERPYGLVITVSLTGDMLQNEGMKTRKHATNIVESMKVAIKKYRSVFSKEAEELFFISLEFNQDTQELFQKFEIQSFPTTIAVTKTHKIFAVDVTYKLGQEYRFTQSNKKEFYDFLEDVFSFGIFDTKDDKISVSIFNIVVGYGVIIVMARALWLFSQKGLLVPLMAIGSIVVFWVSTSGLIKCIIHNLPMMYQDNQGNPQVFINDNRHQTITEGIVMSSSYLIIAFAMSSFTYVGNTFVDSTFKSVFLWATFVIGALTYAFIIDCFQWKSHMRTMIYGFNL